MGAIKPSQVKGARGDYPVWDKKVIKWDSGWVCPGGNEAGKHVWNHSGGWEPDIVGLWARGAGEYGDQVFTMQWDMHAYQVGQRIVEWDSTKIVTHAYYNRIYWTIGQGNNLGEYMSQPEFRILAIENTPDYDSGWVSGGAVGTQTLINCEGLPRTPDFYTFEWTESQSGEGDRGYCMSGDLNYSGNYSTVPVYWDGTKCIFSVGTVQVVQYYDRNNIAKSLATVTQSRYRLKAWIWPASYTSPWTQITTTDRTLLFEHALGEIPFLYLLEFSKDAYGGDDRVPMMSTGVYNLDPYQQSTHLHYMGERYASVLGQDGYVSVYEDSEGIAQSLTTGYVRLKLWI